MNGLPVIEQLFAYVIENEGGLETVPTVLVTAWDLIPHAVIVPLVAADQLRAAALRRLVPQLIQQNPSLAGCRAKLVEFRRGRVLDEITLPALDDLPPHEDQT
jgi:hypothetical protein